MASVKKQHQHAECLNSWGVSFGLTTLRLLTLVSEGYLLKGSTEHNFLNSVVWIRNTFYSGDQEIHFLLLRAKGVKERERAASQTPLYSLASITALQSTHFFPFPLPTSLSQATIILFLDWAFGIQSFSSHRVEVTLR